MANRFLYVRLQVHKLNIMLTKRIVPCLDIKDGRTVKGINFIDLKDAGDPVELAKAYADKIYLLNI